MMQMTVDEKRCDEEKWSRNWPARIGEGRVEEMKWWALFAALSCASCASGLVPTRPAFLARPVPNASLQPAQLRGAHAHAARAAETECDRPNDVSNALALEGRFRACTDPELSPQINHALDVLAGALRVFGPQSVFASFNGGKDAVVILHLLRAAVARHAADASEAAAAADAAPDASGDPDSAPSTPPSPRVIYFSHPDEFEEIIAFVQETEAACGLEMITYDCGLGEGLRQCVAGENGAALGFVLGTRSGDPNSVGQEAFSPSSSYMPPFMRVNPIIDWTYENVWQFLRAFALPYCSLYDDGYTSLGNKFNTERNPALQRPDGTYAPAHTLRDGAMERSGRGPSKP